MQPVLQEWMAEVVYLHLVMKSCSIKLVSLLNYFLFISIYHTPLYYHTCIDYLDKMSSFQHVRNVLILLFLTALASPWGQRGATAPQPALDPILRYAQIWWEVWTHSRVGIRDEYGKDSKSSMWRIMHGHFAGFCLLCDSLLFGFYSFCLCTHIFLYIVCLSDN